MSDLKENLHLQIEFARHSYDNQQAIIRQLDTKAGVFIALLVFLVTEAIPLAKDVSAKLQWVGRGSVSSWLYVSSAVFLAIGFIATAIYVQRVIRPRGSEYATESAGLMFANDILRHGNPEKYHEAAVGASEAALLRSLTAEIFQLSAIVKRKTEALSAAWKPALFSFVMWAFNSLLSIFILSWK